MGITFDACHKLTQQKNFGFIQPLVSKEKEKTKTIVKKRLSQQDKDKHLQLSTIQVTTRKRQILINKI